MKYDLLAIVGPTAVGKTAVAARVALQLGGEILSGDSRQVYRGMDIGTGKDLADYTVDGLAIPYHLIDIVDAGEKYNLHQYQKDFLQAYNSICERDKTPILCGGSGMYLEAVTKGYELPEVPANEALRRELEKKSDEELIAMLESMKAMHNTTDTTSRKRTIRGIEIAMHLVESGKLKVESSPLAQLRTLFIGLTLPVEQRRARIAERLHQRLQSGMIEEVQQLLNNGIPADDLIYYGLEYKFITLYLAQKLSYDAMIEQLNIAIRQFAKRQMTWFRGMERKGTAIHWIEAGLPLPEKVDKIVKLWQQ